MSLFRRPAPQGRLRQPAQAPKPSGVQPAPEGGEAKMPQQAPQSPVQATQYMMQLFRSVLGVARPTVKYALTLMLTKQEIIIDLARRVYQSETGKSWDQLPAAERPQWTERARVHVSAIIDMCS